MKVYKWILKYKATIIPIIAALFNFIPFHIVSESFTLLLWTLIWTILFGILEQYPFLEVSLTENGTNTKADFLINLSKTTHNVAFYPITQGPVELQNKLAQNFPEYVDPVSHKDAESPLRTDWTRLGQSPSWNGRQAFINQFNATYGTQSADWWSARQIHHIRPRIYGGTDDFNNLLPVPNANHYLITSWFRNY